MGELSKVGLVQHKCEYFGTLNMPSLTSVTPHLGPIRSIYFYRHIYLRGLTGLGIPSGCWRNYFLQHYT